MAEHLSLPRVASRCALAGIAAVCLLAGCESFAPWSKRGDDTADLAGSELSIVAGHLATMRALTGPDKIDQEEAFESARAAADAIQTSSQRLRLALAYAVPGHASSSPAEAYRLLTELLGSPEALMESERQLAAVQLAELEQRMILEARIARLDEQAKAPEPAPPRAVVPRRSAEDVERLRTLEALNSELAAQLAEARAKLDAVTAIENTVTRRDDNGDTPR